MDTGEALTQLELIELCASKDAEIAALRKRLEQMTDGLVEHQKHRDAWRSYAYGKRDKPADFLDGNMADRPTTEIESLRTEVSKRHAAAFQALRDRDEAEAKLDRLREKARAVICALHNPRTVHLGSEHRRYQATYPSHLPNPIDALRAALEEKL